MLLTTSEMAERERVNERTIRRMCESGEIQAVKVGGIWLIDTEQSMAKTRESEGAR